MEIVTCPECGAPAEVRSWGALASTAGPVEHVKTLCARRHHLLLPRASLTPAEPAPVRDEDELSA